MALIPQDPRAQQRFLVVLALVGGLVAYWYYIYSPKSVELEVQRDAVVEMEGKNQTAEARIGNLDRLQAELEKVERLFAVVERLVPTEAEVPELYQAIAGESETLGLELTSVTPASPEPTSAGYYLEQRWNMQVEGEYHSLGAFLGRVASLDRIVRPTVSSIQPGAQTPAGNQRVRATLELYTFVLAPDSAAAARAGSTD